MYREAESPQRLRLKTLRPCAGRRLKATPRHSERVGSTRPRGPARPVRGRRNLNLLSKRKSILRALGGTSVTMRERLSRLAAALECVALGALHAHCKSGGVDWTAKRRARSACYSCGQEISFPRLRLAQLFRPVLVTIDI